MHTKAVAFRLLGTVALESAPHDAVVADQPHIPEEQDSRQMVVVSRVGVLGSSSLMQGETEVFMNPNGIPTVRRSAKAEDRDGSPKS